MEQRRVSLLHQDIEAAAGRSVGLDCPPRLVPVPLYLHRRLTLCVMPRCHVVRTFVVHVYAYMLFHLNLSPVPLYSYIWGGGGGDGAGIHPGVPMPLEFGPAYATPRVVLAGPRTHTLLADVPLVSVQRRACPRVPGHSPKRSLGTVC